MLVSQFIAEILKSQLPAAFIFQKGGFKKYFPQQNIDELVQEANNGNQWAQYYVGVFAMAH